MPPHHRRRFCLSLLLIGLSVAALPPGAAAQTCAGPGPESTLCLLNAERAAAGLLPLRLDARLGRAALGHSSDMVAHGYFAHVSPTGEQLTQRVARTGWLRRRSRWILGETLARGSGSLGTPAAVVAAWMRSPPHRSIVLDRRFRRVGIGIVAGTPFPHARDGGTFTADFGARGRLLRRRAATTSRRRARHRSRRPAAARAAAVAHAPRTTRTSSSAAG